MRLLSLTWMVGSVVLLSGCTGWLPSADTSLSRIVYLETKVGGEPATSSVSLWSMWLNGSDRVKIADGVSPDSKGRQTLVSPDGRLVTYKDSQSVRYVVRTNGEERWSVVKGPESDCDVSWSPDSRWLAYSDGHQLFVVESKPDAVATALIERGNRCFAPAFSPNGKHIAYYEGANGSEDQVRLRLMDADGKNGKVLGEIRSKDEKCLGPMWSPDSTAILVADDSLWTLHDIKGGQARTIAEGSLAYFLSSRKLLVANSQGLALVDIVEGSKRLLVGSSGTMYFVPDHLAGQVAYLGGDSPSERGLWVIGIDGGGKTRVALLEEGAQPHIAWADDNSIIVFDPYPQTPSIWRVKPSGEDLKRLCDGCQLVAVTAPSHAGSGHGWH